MIIHFLFAIAALLGGLFSIIVNPKGGIIHKKSGRFYYYCYIGIILSALAMLIIKFKMFFLGLTIFNSYLVFSGIYYSKKKEKRKLANWVLKSVLISAIFVYLYDTIFVFSNIEHYEYGWVVVRCVYTTLAILVFLFEFLISTNRILLHAATMLLSYITLLNGIFARLSPKAFVWVFWILGYFIFLPIIFIWFKKSKKFNSILKLKF